MPTSLHILNVGRGACTVVEHPSGRRSMIDINIARRLPPDERHVLAESGRLLEAAREEAALTHPITWYRSHFGALPLFRFINSHPDMDHLLGVGHVLNGNLPAACFWDLPHTKIPAGFQTREDVQHWTAYGAWRRQELSGQPHRLTQWKGADTYWFGSCADYDHIELLWPDPQSFRYYNGREDWNNMSLVLRIWHGGRSVLLPGDIEAPTWRALAAAEDCGEITLKSDVLVASHHGRMTGYPPDGILARIDPLAVVISTDRLPVAHNAARHYARAAEVFSTRWHGDLHVHLDDHETLEIDSDSERLLHRARGFWYGFAHG